MAAEVDLAARGTPPPMRREHFTHTAHHTSNTRARPLHLKKQLRHTPKPGIRLHTKTQDLITKTQPRTPKAVAQMHHGNNPRQQRRERIRCGLRYAVFLALVLWIMIVVYITATNPYI